MPSLTLHESRRRAELLDVTSYDLELDLHAAPADSFAVRATGRFACREPGATTFIELADARDLSATLNGRPVPGYDGARLPLVDLAAENTLVVDAVVPTVTNGDGLHQMTDPADGETYLSAYCGMDIASKVFPCFDQPDLKAPIRLTVTAPEAWTVLANGEPEGAPDPAGTGRRRWTFTPTAPISPYLFVVCAGPWASVTWEHDGLPFGWHARASLAAELERDAAELRAVTEACFDHYAEVFDQPYPFGSYDQVMVPGQNWGALETPGCVTYRDELLFRGEPSEVERQARASVIAHEMAHMWFGNLVTMRWWEDSWLNESFADFMGYHVAARAAGMPDTWVLFAMERKATGFLADERSSTHPVAEDTEAMVDIDTAFANFDMITYAKGASAVKQLATWLGEETFLAGVNTYFDRHAFGNADLADFLDALDSVSDRDVRGWAQAWLRTTGFDTVTVRRDGAGVPSLVRQGSRPHRLSVGSLTSPAALVDLDADPMPLPELAGLPVLPNAGDETFVRLDLDDESWAAVAAGLGGVGSAVTRGVLWRTAVDRTRRGQLALGDLLELADAHLSGESNPVVFECALRTISEQVFGPLPEPADWPGLVATLAGVCDEALGALQRDRPPATALAASRVLAASSSDTGRLSSWLEDGVTDHGVPLEPELRWRVVRRLAVLQPGDAEELVDHEAAADQTALGQQSALRARASVPTAAAKAWAWEQLVTGEPSNRDFEALGAGFWSPGQHELLSSYLDRYLAEAPAVARRRGQAFSRAVGRAFPLLPLPTPVLSGFVEALGSALEEPAVPTVLRRTWSDRWDDLRTALSAR